MEKQAKNKQDSGLVNEYDHFRGLWQSYAKTEELERHCRSLCTSPEAWKKAPNLCWIVCLSFLLEDGREQDAKVVFNRYLAKYGRRDFHRSVRVAEYAIQQGVSSSAIVSTMAVWRCLKESPTSSEFTDYIRGKRIAVVGNGKCELGLGKGEEIDNHDIVIRFNNYQIEGREADYGTKTDVWVRDGSNKIKQRSIAPYRFVLFEPDLSRTLLHKDVVTVLRRYIESYPQKLFYMDTEFKRDMREETGLLNPSPSCTLVYFLYKALGSLKDVDLYGFEDEWLIKKLIGIPVESESRHVLYVAAYRRCFPIKSGKTGGPGGVCALMREFVGKDFREYDVRYLFQEAEPDKSTRPFGQEMPWSLNRILFGADFIFQHPEIKSSLDNNEIVRMVCHDLGTAYGAFLAGIPYVLVYHQQGSLAQELESSGQPCQGDLADLLKSVETKVFCNAYKVYFPSLGARDDFRRTSLMDKEDLERVRFSSTALYNTVHEEEIQQSGQDSPCLEDVLGGKAGADSLALMRGAVQQYDEVFLSIGDFLFAKGMDRVPDFIEKYVEATGKKVAWIAIGQKGNDDLYQSIVSSSDSWNFDAFIQGVRIDHEVLLQLLEVVDYYIMLHRSAIFDLAILEAMHAGKCVILSNVGGNPEFNVQDNVLLVDCDRIDDAIQEMRQLPRDVWGSANRDAFQNHFSPMRFRERYHEMMGEFLEDVTS